jgi:hypothetical protein
MGHPQVRGLGGVKREERRKKGKTRRLGGDGGGDELHFIGGACCCKSGGEPPHSKLDETRRAQRKRREEEDWKRRGTEASGRKSPPFAQNAKDGAPSSSRVKRRWKRNPRTQSGVTVPPKEPKTHTQRRRVGHPAACGAPGRMSGSTSTRETQEHRQECLCHKRNPRPR